MDSPIFQFSVAAAAIALLGTLLVRLADRLADASGWSRAFIGSIFLAGATSLPELVVDLRAVRAGQPDLAVGDLLGSSLFNLLILAILDTAFGQPRRTFTGDFSAHARSAVLSIQLSAVVGIGLLGGVGGVFFGVGSILWAVVPIYLVAAREQFRDAAAPETIARAAPSARVVLRFIATIAGCAAGIAIASPFLIEAADAIAVQSGLAHGFIGTTLVALSTSLPELVATFVAFRMGSPELALGNILGSNTFNMTLLFPLDAVDPGSLLNEVSPSHALTAFCVIVTSSIAVMGQISRRQRRNGRFEPSSAMVILVSLAFLALLWRRSAGPTV